MIESDIRQLIVASDAFAQIAEGRLYPVLFPESACFPASTYQLISLKPIYAIDGAINFMQTRIQFDAWAETYSKSKQLMIAIREAIDDFSGVLPSGTRIFGIQLITASDGFESDARVYRSTADFSIQFSYGS